MVAIVFQEICSQISDENGETYYDQPSENSQKQTENVYLKLPKVYSIQGDDVIVNCDEK